MISDLFSGHTGIYRAQRIGHSKHRPLPQDIKLGDVAAHRHHLDEKARAAAPAAPDAD